MKSYRFFALLAISLISLTACEKFAQAQEIMKIKSGDASIFHEEISFNVVINDADPIIDGKYQNAKDYYTSKSETEYSNFLRDLDRAHESFVTYYNEKKGVIKSSIDNTPESLYTLTIDVTTMNVGNGGGFAYGLSKKSGGAVVYGTMIFTDNTSGNILCEFEFSGIKGLLSPKFNGRAISVYRYLADAFIKTIQ